MRFRISHLLLLTALVAIFATALAFPTKAWAAAIRVIIWPIYGQLMCMAAKQEGRKRAIYILAVVFGLSYVAYTRWWYGTAEAFPMPYLVTTVFETLHASGKGAFDKYVSFVSIWETGMSFVVALVGGASGAYWSRTSAKE